MTVAKGQVLVVDDEKNLCRILSKILQDAGYDVSVAYTAKSALKVLAEEAIDAVLADIRMPEMDGIELLEHIKNKDPDFIRRYVTTGLVDDFEVRDKLGLPFEPVFDPRIRTA